MDINSLTKEQLIERRDLLLRKQQLLSQQEKEPSAFIDKIIGGGLTAAGAYGAYKIAKPIGMGISYTAKGIKNLPLVTNTKKGAEFERGLIKEFAKTHEDAVTNFGKDIVKWSAKYPNRSVDLSEFISEIQTNPEFSREAIKIFQKTPILSDIMKNPQSASAVPLKDVQDIINHLNTKVPKNIKINNFDLLEGINTIRGSQIEAFPEMGQTRLEYQKFKEPYKLLKAKFKPNTLLETSIPKRFGGATGWESMKKLLPPKVVEQIRGYKAASQVAKIPKMIPFVNKLFAIAPFIDAIKYSQDPEAYLAGQMTGGMAQLEPKGSLERKIQLKQVI